MTEIIGKLTFRVFASYCCAKVAFVLFGYNCYTLPPPPKLTIDSGHH